MHINAQAQVMGVLQGRKKKKEDNTEFERREKLMDGVGVTLQYLSLALLPPGMNSATSAISGTSNKLTLSSGHC